MTGRNWSDASPSQETPTITGNCQELDRVKERFSPGAFRESIAQRTSNLQNWESRNLF